MAVDPVPWMIENGASHSTNVTRNITYAVFGGRDGIVNGPDFEVRELAVPGSSVRVFPGTVAIKNRAAGIRDEMYVARAVTETTVAIAATGGTARSDMIVAQVENPWLPGEPWADPPSNANGPYFFIRVISNVPSTAKTVADAGISGNSAYPLARIDVPASTATITQAMVKDLRRIAVPHSERAPSSYANPTALEKLTSATYIEYPSTSHIQVDIPDWATNCNISVPISAVAMSNVSPQTAATGNVQGSLRVALVGAASTVTGPPVAYDTASGSPGGSDQHGYNNTVLASAMTIPAGNRGAPATITLQGLRTGFTGTSADGLVIYYEAINVEFYNAPTSNV